MPMSRTKKMVFTAMCIALGIVLPITLHMIPNAGGILLPMHIPVLICGLICGWPWGLLCGALAPLLSSLFTGMPPAAILPAMLCELAVYGLVTGLLLPHVRTGHDLADLYLSLVGAMLAGRLVSGVLKALIFNVGGYSLQIWVTGSFITALPGIMVQLVVIPVIVQVLIKARVVARV